MPTAKLTNGVAADLGTFEKTGADIEKLVDKIEYVEGPSSGGVIVATTTYLSTDWINTGTAPVLRLTFAGGSSSNEAPIPTKPGGM